jgi:transposase
MKYKTTSFIESIVPDLVKHVCQESGQKSLRGIIIHLDNPRRHNSKKSEVDLTATKARRIPAPTYSPDLSPSGFFLLGMLKERTSGPSSSSPDELSSPINELIASLQEDQLTSVDKNWMKPLNWAVNPWGQYYCK